MSDVYERMHNPFHSKGKLSWATSQAQAQAQAQAQEQE